MIGSLGEIVFEVSAEKVRTFKDMTRDIKATFGSHDIINGKPKLQHTGSELVGISFSMAFRVDIGLDPKKELEQLKKMTDSGDAHKLFIGDDYMGQFVIEGVNETREHIDNKGRLLGASANITLKEYI